MLEDHVGIRNARHVPGQQEHVGQWRRGWKRRSSTRHNGQGPPCSYHSSSDACDGISCCPLCQSETSTSTLKISAEVSAGFLLQFSLRQRTTASSNFGIPCLHLHPVSSTYPDLSLWIEFPPKLWKLHPKEQEGVEIGRVSKKKTQKTQKI